MLASIVVPTYDRPRKLERTIESVCTQTAADYEVIVVDDGSTADRQAAVLDRAADRDRVRVLRQSNAGPAAARNRGWQVAAGTYVLFTDDDCIVPDDWVESLTAAFEPAIAAVGGTLVPSEAALAASPFARAHRLRDRIDYSEPTEPVRGHDGLNVAGTANVAYRRTVLEETGGFDESFPLAAGEDADLQRRVLEAGYEMKYVPVAVVHNDDYEWQSFVSRAVRSGEGTYHFHRTTGDTRSASRIVLGLIGSPVYFPAAVWQSRDPIAAGLYVLERCLNRWGELREALG